MAKGNGDDHVWPTTTSCSSGPLPSLHSKVFLSSSKPQSQTSLPNTTPHCVARTSSSSPMAPPLPASTSHQPHFLPHHSSHSCTLFLFKLAVLSALLLLALPLFPSRPHEPSTLVNHFWELLHLLFVGIAFSYGLFSRKTFHFPVSDQSPSCSHDSLSDLSMIFHVSSSSSSSSLSPDLKASSSFQHTEPLNPSGYDDTNVIQAWNSQYNQTPSMVVVANGYRSLGLPVRSLKSTVSDLHGSGLSSDSNDSPPFSSSSSSFKSSSDQMRNRNLGPTHLDTDRALPSPISWRSRSGRMEVAEKVSKNAARVRPLSVDETQFESLRARPPHFQAKASSFSPQAIPSSAASKQPLSDSVSYKQMEMGKVVHSSSMYFELSNSKMEDFIYKKMGSREEMDSVTGQSHFRPPSIDETECESSKSESFRSDASFSSNASSLYASSNNHSPLQSISSELPDSNIQEEPSDFVRSSHIGPLSGDETQSESFKSRHFQPEASYSARTGLISSSPDNQSESAGSIGALEKEKNSRRSSQPTMPMDGEAPANKLNHRKGSNGSLSTEKNNVGGDFEDMDDLSGSRRGLLKQHRKREALPKASSRGKSVRTIRSSSRTAEARYSRDSFTDYKVEKMFHEDEAVEMRARGNDNPPKHTRNQNSEKHKAAWKLAGEDGDFSDCSEDEQVEEELVAIAKSGLRADPDEVNKKADEFIAKFREQIRLQKTASIDLSGELNINDNYFR